MARDPDAATPATYKCYFVGAEPEIGATMIVDETEFTVISKENTEENCWLITSVDTGTDMNNFASGTAVIPDDDIDDLENCTLGELVVAAADIEDDDSARARMLSGGGGGGGGCRRGCGSRQRSAVPQMVQGYRRSGQS
jgi:hypothetical protein